MVVVTKALRMLALPMSCRPRRRRYQGSGRYAIVRDRKAAVAGGYATDDCVCGTDADDPRICSHTLRSRHANASMSTPNMTAYRPVSNTRVSAPAAGSIRSRIPNTSESTPETIRVHSLVMTLRKRIAANTSRTPVAIAQVATTNTSASAALAGQKNAIKPAAIPTMPSSSDAQMFSPP